MNTLPTIQGYALEELVLADVLRARARSQPGASFLAFRDGELSYGEVDEISNRLAQGLRGLGVGPRDHVALMLGNCADFVCLVFALAKLGAVVVPVNIAYKGELLRHVLASSDACLLVVDEPLLEATADTVEAAALDHVVVRGRPGPGFAPLSSLLAGEPTDPEVPVAFSDTQAIMYTSGTTGPSKGVITSHALALSCALDSLTFLDGWGKTYYTPLPLFHAAGLWDGMMAALLSGSKIGIVERFSASRFWDDVRAFGAQVSMGVFSMIPILLKQPPAPNDTDHPLETFYMGKSALDEPMRERFGVRSVETYTSTEAGIPIASPYGEWKMGSCGREHSERFEVVLVDEHDRPVPSGEPGEIVLRPKQPFVITSGYYSFDDVTARTFRNMWFHTGDRAWRDTDGYFYFLDRMKDAIRRRGENISAFDIECELNLHPAVLESAAIGVPSELEEEEVKVDVVLTQSAELDAAELAAYCEDRLPAFMVPRFIEFVDALPRSATGKIAKHRLRERGERGLTPQTWDREEHLSEGAEAS